MATDRSEIGSRTLCRFVAFVARNGAGVAWACVLATLALGAYAALHLGINSNNLALIGDEVPSKIAQLEFAKTFLTLDEALLVVVDGETPEAARDATETLEAALRAQPESFTNVYQPGGGDFFERRGLLYRTVDDLYNFSDQMIMMQPVMAQLEREASISQLAEIVELSLEEMRKRDAGAREWAMVLDRVSQATVDMYEEYPLSISWEEILLRGSSLDVTTRRVIVTQPALEFGSLLGAGRVIDIIRDTAARNGLVPERGVRVRLTGNPALNYEEMIGLMWDIAGAGLFCFALVAGVVYVAMRSVKVMVAVLATLIVGLVWTGAFAAAAVGHLNLVSISFAVLFIGLGVDFGIHFGMAYGAAVRTGLSHEEALQDATRSVGTSLVLCAMTTAIGFAVFVPTDYQGVAELGLIASGGMVVIVSLFLSFFPALLSSWLRVDAANAFQSELHFRFRWWAPLERRPGVVLAVSAVAFGGALLLLPESRFDPNAIGMRDDATESVQAFEDLLAEPGSAPWYINVVEPDLARARATADAMRGLASVEHALTLADYIPTNQEEKLEVLGDVAMVLDVPADTAPPREPLSTEEQIQAIRDLQAFFAGGWMLEWESESGTALKASIGVLQQHLTDFLARVERDGDPEEALVRLEAVLFDGLPAQIARMRTAVNTRAVAEADLPDELVRRMRAPDGRARVQIFPSQDLSDLDAMNRFVAEVRSVAPAATSVVVNLVEFGKVTVAAFEQALLSAIVLIALLLLVIWRNLRDTLLALTPLVMAAAFTGASMVLLGIYYDFTNVIVIPLLLAIGVDSGIHLVHRFKSEGGGGGDLMDTTTARAVVYSALTTTVSFGSLAFSSHNGMRTLGMLLTAGMVFTVGCNLIVLPALLDVLGRRDAPAEPSAVPAQT